MTRKKLIAIITTSLITIFLITLFVLSVISIYKVSKLRPFYGDDINLYIIVTYAQMTCVLAGFLDVAIILHVLFSREKDGQAYDNSSIVRLVSETSIAFLISITLIFLMKYKTTEIPWLPYFAFTLSGFSLLVFLVEFLIPIKKKKTYNET